MDCCGLNINSPQLRRLFKKPPSILTSFQKFPNLPVELRLRIWEHSLPGPRIVEVRHFRFNTYQDAYHFTSTRAPPTALSICQESRSVALEHYKFCHSSDMKVFLDPSIDTLFFGITWTSGSHFKSFINHAHPADLKALQKLAVNEIYLTQWSSRPHALLDSPLVTSNLIRPSLFSVLPGLKKLIIAIQLDVDGDVDNPGLPFDVWEGWLFGGGPLTQEELQPRPSLDAWIFSAYSVGGHLFPVPSGPYPDDFPLDWRFMRQPRAFEYFYARDDRYVLRKHKKEIAELRRRADVTRWYKKVFDRIGIMNGRVKRLFEMHQRRNERSPEEWIPPLVACAVRANGTFLKWENCLGLLSDEHWLQIPALERYKIKGNAKKEIGDWDESVVL